MASQGRPPSAPPAPRGAPQFIRTATVVQEGQAWSAGDEFASVKIAESKGWRSMFPDLPDNDGSPGCCGRFKFAVWAIVVIALLAGAIGLSIAMVVIHSNNTDTNGEPWVPPGVLSPAPDTGGGSNPTPSPLPNTDQDGSLEVETAPPFPVPSGWTALWWDEFDGSSLDTTKWNYDIGYGKDYGLWAWGNQEQEYYKAENVDVSNGVLTITAKEEITTLPDGYKFNYTSARINTRGKAGFYGGMTTADGRTWGTIRIETSIKSPAKSTSGLWGAFWMLPIDMRYGVWASSGELDLYEQKNEFMKNNYAIHYGGPWPKYNRRGGAYLNRVGGGSFSDQFTTFAMEWEPTKITMESEGVEQVSMNSRSVDPNGFYSDAINAPAAAPFDVPFYFIFNLAVGGRYPGNVSDGTVLPAQLQMDYIRVFGKP